MSNGLVIDLFSGTKSLEQPALDLGFDYFSVDIDASLEPDLVADIFTLQSYQITLRTKKAPLVVWASPPCTHFSVASIGKNWIKDKEGNPIPKTEGARCAIELVKNTLILIAELGPRWYFIENPRGMLRRFMMMRTRPYMNTVTYCQYGDTRMKPTDIWHNNSFWRPIPACKNGDPCHERAPRGSRQGTQGIKGAISRGVVPYKLLYEILQACS